MQHYGLVGKGLSHSFSPAYFADKFSREHIAADYRLFDVEEVADLRKTLQNKHLSGFNVTIPYKETIIPLLDDIAGAALEIGAVNTVKIIGDHWCGYNTDWIGFRDSLQPLLTAGHKRALLIGTGGASKAVSYALRQLKIEITLCGRSSGLLLENVTPEIIADHQLIINCTPLGTFPNTDTRPEIPYAALTPDHLAYDLVYNPPKTAFLKAAESQGAVIKNGHEMLVLQAEEAYRIWSQHL